MAEPLRTKTTVGEAFGPTHAGAGNQVNNYWDYQSAMRRYSLPADTNDVRIGWLRKRFVPPAGFDDAVVKLHSDEFLVISANAGSGRHTTVHMLAEATAATVYPVPTNSDSAQLRSVDFSGMAAGDIALIDLSTLDRYQFADYLRDLNALKATMRAEDGRCIALILCEQEEWAPELRPDRIRMERPDIREVLERHLSALGLHVQVNLDEAVRTLRKLPLTVTEQFVDAVDQAKKNAPESAAADWFTEAIRMITGYPGDIAKQFAENADARSRTLMITAAALEGAAVEAVSWAEYVFAQRCGCVMEPLWIERQGLLAQLGRIGVTIGARRIAFPKPGYARALLIRFWDEFAGAHMLVGRWLADIVACTALDEDDRARMADLAADLLLRSHELTLLAEIAEKWAVHRAWPVRALARRFLHRAAADESDGNAVRQQLSRWSRRPTLPIELAFIITDISESELEDKFPEQALQRLHFLTGHRSPAVSDIAVKLLGEYIATPGGYRKTVTTLATSSAPRERFFPLILDRFVNEHRADETVRNALKSWSLAMLRHSNTETLASLLSYWLSIDDPRETVRILVDSAEERFEWARLLFVIREWCAEQRDHTLLRYSKSLIDDAMGLSEVVTA